MGVSVLPIVICQTDFFNLSSSPLARQIEVESSEVGYIIGKGGEQIRELQQMSQCRDILYSGTVVGLSTFREYAIVMRFIDESRKCGTHTRSHVVTFIFIIVMRRYRVT